MPSFQGGSVRLQSGANASSSMQAVPRVTNVKIDWNAPRANVMVLNRGKPLENRPIINYIPVDASVDVYGADSQVSQMLGICNPSGVCQAITETRGGLFTHGVKNMHVLFAPTSSANYNGELDLKSGVLTSYTLQGSVGDPVRESFGMQFLDMSGAANFTTRDSSNVDANLIKPEGVSLTGVQLTGLGLTGTTNQSFSFALGFGRASVMQLGTKFPIERPLTDVGASLQLQGWFDGQNNSFTGLNAYAGCGEPMVGTVALTLSPSCGATSPRTITMKNPYIDSCSIEAAVGGFSTFAISLSLPIGPNPNETSDGSVVIIN